MPLLLMLLLLFHHLFAFTTGVIKQLFGTPGRLVAGNEVRDLLLCTNVDSTSGIASSQASDRENTGHRLRRQIYHSTAFHRSPTHCIIKGTVVDYFCRCRRFKTVYRYTGHLNFGIRLGVGDDLHTR
uniref:Secreted protein n=1 Tax=Taenia asiatica TaxID=60517 RepID=A0A0R3W617_TAEAS